MGSNWLVSNDAVLATIEASHIGAAVSNHEMFHRCNKSCIACCSALGAQFGRAFRSEGTLMQYMAHVYAYRWWLAKVNQWLGYRH